MMLMILSRHILILYLDALEHGLILKLLGFEKLWVLFHNIHYYNIFYYLYFNNF